MLYFYWRKTWFFAFSRTVYHYSFKLCYVWLKLGKTEGFCLSGESPHNWNCSNFYASLPFRQTQWKLCEFTIPHQKGKTWCQSKEMTLNHNWGDVCERVLNRVLTVELTATVVDLVFQKFEKLIKISRGCVFLGKGNLISFPLQPTTWKRSHSPLPMELLLIPW